MCSFQHVVVNNEADLWIITGLYSEYRVAYGRTAGKKRSILPHLRIASTMIWLVEIAASDIDKLTPAIAAFVPKWSPSARLSENGRDFRKIEEMMKSRRSFVVWILARVALLIYLLVLYVKIDSVESDVDSIKSDVDSINSTVDEINGTVGDIQANMRE
jgi:hypothetical protein